ncbi:MAG: T9SS type A sorting domain-containing protein [Candidatus Marinimicrobia bacterium]|nr:T9SS type A sorting domain-containing protein [Candidatus Neomarinimicrobiota bacterium]
MKVLVSFSRCFFPIFFFVVLVSTNVLIAQESFLQPYTVDEHTVVLLHFDGNLVNESDKASDATGFGNYNFIPNDELSGFGQCVWFDNDSRSDSSYIIIPDTVTLDLDTSWTVECWVKVLSFGTQAGDWHIYPKVVSKPSNWWLGINGASGTFNVQSGYETDMTVWHDVFTQNEIIETEVWYHIAAILDVDNKVYTVIVHDRDGNLVAYNSSYIPEVAIIPRTTSDPVQIGVCLWWPDTWLNGLVDEVRISNCVRKFDIPPEIVSYPTVRHVDENVPIDITIQLASISSWEYTNVELHYAPVAETDVENFNVVEMSSTDNVNFTGTIPAQDAGTSLKYFITVENTDGEVANSMLMAEESDTAFFGIAVGYKNSLVLDMDFEQNLEDATGLNTVVATGPAVYSDDAKVGNYSIHFTPVPVGENDTLVSMLKIEKPAPFLAFSDGYTMEMWVKPDTVFPWAAFLGKYPEYYNDDNDWKFNYRLYFDGRHLNKLNIENYHCNTVWHRVYIDDYVLEPDQWYKIVAQYSAEKKILMIELYDEEGNLISENWEPTEEYPLMVRAGDFTIGGDTYDYMADVRFQGKMDGLKVYNYAKALPPSLVSSPPPRIAKVSPNESEVIQVDIDNSISTKLFYSVNGGEEIVINMEKTGDFTYSGTIPGQSKGSIVEYYIVAENDVGKKMRLPGSGNYILKYMEDEGLVLHLDFEQGTGTPLDNSDYNNEISVFGDISYSEDAFSGNYSLYYGSEGGYIRINPPAPFVINNEMTLEISFNADEIPIGGTDLIAKYPDPPSWEFGFRVSFQADGKLFPEIYLVADTIGVADRRWTSLFLKNDTRIVPGQWYTFIMDVGKDSAYVRLLDDAGNVIDQSEKISVAGQHLNPVAGMLAIGRSWEENPPLFKGKIDNIKIYNYSKAEKLGIDFENKNLITNYYLAQNYPNPFNPTTNIEFMIPNTENVKLVIYNILGQEVRTLVNSKHNAGRYVYIWDGKDNSNRPVPSGIYIYKLETAAYSRTRKMVFIR